MGDRNNPIKFGPEWLRNMPRERSAARSNNSQNASSSAGPSPGQSAGSSAGPSSSSGGATATNTTPTTTAPTTNNSNTPSKVLLAKQRYGREEMLALFDRNAEAPPELKFIDTLYQPRGKQPVALNNTFEDDVRDNLRGAPPIGAMASGDRFGMGRGAGRGNERRGGSRGAYVRQPSLGRGAMWHVGPRMLTSPYSGGPEDDSGPTRPWTNNNNLNNTNRNSGDQADWATKMFRNKRQGNNTNWRQPQSRDDGEEWRSSEAGRSRLLEKWDRDWGDRPSGEKPQSWNNRRTWGGDNQNNEENLPEWAIENAECGGTFDSSGAFHGYSNDDTNLPKHHESSYPLTRSHTHGSFPRPKVVEEGSEEWWASEKAKKLSPKRFDASDLKFKKQPGIGIADVASTSSNNNSRSSKEEMPQETPETQEAAAGPESSESNATGQEEASDERGNFQSVIINSNNSLRQKHQHLVPAMSEASSTQIHNMKPSKQNNQSEMDHVINQSHEELLADNQFDRGLYELEELSSCSSNSLITLSGLGLSSGLASLANSMPPNQNMIISMANPSGPSNHGMNMEIHGNKSNMQTAVVQPVHHPSMQPSGMNTGGMNTGGMNTGGMNTGGMNTGGMNTGGMNTGGMNTGGMNTGGMNPGGIQSGSAMQAGLQMPGMPVGMQPGMSGSGYPPSVVMQSNLSGMPSGSMQNMSGMTTGGMPNMPGMQAPQGQTPSHQVHSGLQNVGITNSALNASLGLPIGGPNMGGQQHRMPLQGMQQQVMPNVGMPNNSSMPGSGMGGMGSTSMQGAENMPGFQPMPGMGNNMGNASLFLNSNTNNTSMASTINDIPMSNHTGQNNMLLHLQGLQGSQGPYGNPMYGNNTNNNLLDQWYYEDPERNVQGPFSSRDMLNWYRVGFFSPSLMVRRACETMMRPLGSYGPVVPFANVDNMMSGFPMSNAFELPQGGHENMLNAQPSMSLDVDSLWGQGPSSSSDLMWIQQPMNRTEPRVNNMSMYFWDQPSAINSNSLLPEEITKEMKTEDQILAQLRATQNIGQQQQPFLADLPVPSVTPSKPDDYERNVNATPNMEELQKLIQKETLTGQPNMAEEDLTEALESNLEKSANLEQSSSESSITKSSSQTKNNAEAKQLKAKETDKTTKNKENNNTKNKSKKSKEEKKEEVSEVKTKEEDVNKAEKRSQESSPTKNKKEEKSNKKDIEKEKKEWIKEGFTIVKGPEKSASKDNKKKAEEARLAEEAERKRKEEEKLAADEDKKKKQAEAIRKQQEQQALQQQRQVSESVVKKAPWSAVATQAMQATNHDGLTLAEIQRLEREKKLEQMKEQQQMMQIIAQQQAAALAREQEMQAGLGWAKKKASNQTQGQSLTEIQAEARKQAFAAAAKAIEEADVSAPPQTNHAPWANTHNGVGGFWDTQPNSSKTEKQQESQKTTEQSQKKKKPTLTISSKKDTSPSVEFEAWCTNVLSSWSSKIDVPTFVGFLKDIESPYEVKDYVKCYLGETKESSDFARQFLERRSKLLRVGMVTPSDDLCSPAIAVNPRTPSSSDYQEVKGKGKKTKKNKMLKVDVRILGFSVTAAEDRINVGDIDTV